MVKRRTQERDKDAKDRVIGGVPVGYLELVHELAPQAAEPSQPLKRRKAKSGGTNDAKNEEVSGKPVKKQITDTESSSRRSSSSSFPSMDEENNGNPSESESEDVDIQWEDVEIEENLPIVGSPSRNTEQRDLTIQLGAMEKRAGKQKSKAAALSASEKYSRKLFHMVDILCILHHVEVRNMWCNDYELRKSFRTLLPPTILQELHPPAHLSDTLKTRKFLDGLRHAVSFWYKKFSVTSFGMRMIGWNEILRKDRVIENRMPRDRFRSHLLQMRGNRDLCAQGFCALLRSIDIDCRLVCSLQPLDFTSNVPMEPISTNSPQYNSYPVFWIEAWDKAGQRWVTADPGELMFVDIVRGKSKLEPPFSDANNLMRYVIAFEADGAATDVTRRYASQFNAKTRKKRVTVFDDGVVWWERVMNIFRRWNPTQRDIMEKIELDRRQEKEDMPNNIQDFKGHPIYVLEQHLKATEVLDPKLPCGTLALKSKQSSVPVYKRSNVKTVRSAQNWYRQGRVIKPGMQPMKRLPRRKSSTKKKFEDDFKHSNIEEEPDTPMYCIEQTELYIPPAVVDGVIPKNAFGNIDIYVPSMIPAGGVHLPYPNIRVAARLIAVDYADAVVGFDFNRRRINPQVAGIVVAEEHKEAVMAVYEQLVEEQRQEEQKLATVKALARWRRYVFALRIKERLNKQHGVVEEDERMRVSSGGDSDDVAITGERVLSKVTNFVSKDDVISISDDSRKSKEPDCGDFGVGGGFIVEHGGDSDEGGFIMEGGGLLEEESGGGFVEEESDGGGFRKESGGGFSGSGDDPVHAKSRCFIVGDHDETGGSAIDKSPDEREAVAGSGYDDNTQKTVADVVQPIALDLVDSTHIGVSDLGEKDSTESVPSPSARPSRTEDITEEPPCGKSYETLRHSPRLHWPPTPNIVHRAFHNELEPENTSYGDVSSIASNFHSENRLSPATVITEPESESRSFLKSGERSKFARNVPMDDEESEDFFPQSMSESELMNSE